MRTRRLVNIAAALVLGLAVSGALAADFARIEKVFGDRQILVTGEFVGGVPAAPFTVRAVADSGDPLEGKSVTIAPTATQGPCAFRRDEFGYFGFNYFFEVYSCIQNGGTWAFTNADGLATIVRSIPSGPASAFLVGAAAQPASDTSVPAHARLQYFSIVRAVNPPPGNPSVVVEYFNEDVRHYFNTILQSEIDALDRWQIPGWTRSVGSFIAWEKAADAPPGAVPVCRFFSARYTSHFYTADPFECDAVVALFAEDWLLETREAFYIYRPDPVTGACIAGTMPVYRVFGGATRSPNHRYVTDAALRDVMVAQGWIAEGYGPNAVIMCTPR